jgi:hypothetical protein
MFLSGVQSEFYLDSRLKHAGMTDYGRSKLRGINLRRLNLGFRICFGFRASNFGFDPRHWPTP